MTYLEAVKTVREIEARYDVMAVTYNGISVWPLLRINLIDKLSGHNETMKSGGSSAVKQVLGTLFYYNPSGYLKRKKLWLFAGFERRKEVGGLRQLRVSGGILKACPDTLVIEKPSKHQRVCPRKTIPEKSIVSESWLLLFVHAIAALTKRKRINLENEEILRQILKDYGMQFNYMASIRLLLSQKNVFDILLSIAPNPDKVIIECPYTVMGYVWSLHEKGIRVIEMQHGVLNDKHYAYNSLYSSPILYPDEICVFGEDEYKYLKSDGFHYCKEVHKTGLYYLDLAKKNFTDDVFAEFRGRYNYIILVAGQRGYEEILATYVREVAKKTPDCLYVYVPRSNDAGLEFIEGNIIYRPGINIYQYMIWCDVHLTISSTTCLECQYYGKPTIFYNYEDMSANYYGKVLEPRHGVVYTDSASEFVNALKDVTTKDVTFKEVFAANPVEKIRQIISK